MKRSRGFILLCKALDNQENTQESLTNSEKEAVGNFFHMDVDKSFLNYNTELSEKSSMPDINFNNYNSGQDPLRIEINPEFCTVSDINNKHIRGRKSSQH